MNDTVSIALATYNGSKFLPEMLDSINKQTYPYFMIHICDDGSTDNTIATIKGHKLFVDGKIIIHDVNGGCGALKNFKRTIEYCTDNYIALCDQDDYWVPEKLSVLMNSLKEYENRCHGPKLIFSDLQIVDSTLSCLYPSFYSASGKSSKCKKPLDFLLSNHIPGCAMMFNKELKTLLEPIPDDIRMHDWWIALLASYYGEIIYEPSSLIKYRQHDTNTIGASDMIHQNISAFQMLRNIRTLVLRSKKIQKEFITRFSEIGYRYPRVNDSFLRLIENKTSLIEKYKLYKKANLGESKIISFCAWWFL
ncbi:glycosyltransferase family 2 protein [Buttiauxella noackiae]|uniref:glycosyltransferase family 2 protein n=1 Tax=Buttiauxella noackiae TaxID=82992 RepID=UPI00054CDEC5|nr:glycosyltransferase family 2 protein [Buttiauxella noackiae]